MEKRQEHLMKLLKNRNISQINHNLNKGHIIILQLNSINL